MLLRGRSPISWLLMWRSLSSEPWTLGLTLSRSGDLVSASHKFKMWMSISVPVGMLHAMALLVNINTMSKPRPYQLPPDTAVLPHNEDDTWDAQCPVCSLRACALQLCASMSGPTERRPGAQSEIYLLLHASIAQEVTSFACTCRRLQKQRRALQMRLKLL